MLHFITAVERKVVKKGSAAVDSVCPIAESSHVFEENGVVWDCMLNQVSMVALSPATGRSVFLMLGLYQIVILTISNFTATMSIAMDIAGYFV